ncbi:MAG: thermonuclease family protein [Deltaproteobacteria bacterium]|nr:thermonuclease family protein [Deltaproteobacteria bacterium]
MRRLVASAVALAIALVAGSACEEVTGGCGNSSCGPCTGTVVEVIDGDTIRLETGETIRYIGVDTPETTSGKAECFGSEAVDRNIELVLGKDVVLEYDVECTDRFGRNLAYVYADGVLVSESLISGGFGCSLGIAPDVLYQPALDAAEARAKNAGAGQWSACEASQRKESCAN